jgi:hypothetical protein
VTDTKTRDLTTGRILVVASATTRKGIYFSEEIPLTINILDINGRMLTLVQEGTMVAGNYLLPVPVDMLSSGLYVFQVITGGEIRTLRFVKR